jgi:hypothetical protein
MIIICLFTGLHYKFVFTGRTTVEYCMERNKRNTKEHKYDFGYYENFCSVFNTNPFLWYLPLNINLRGKGIFFENEEIETR